MTAPGAIKGGVRAPQQHDSGHKHVAGAATYVDDIPTPSDCLSIAFGLSPKPANPNPKLGFLGLGGFRARRHNPSGLEGLSGPALLTLSNSLCL